MAQLAIPLIALGGLYIISNHEKEEDEENQREGFINEINNIPQSLPVKPIAVNYPKLKNISQTAPRYFASPNQATDKYFNQSVYTKIEQNNPKESVGGSVQPALSLTGEKIDKKNFKHNNMIPFFGGKVKGATVSADIAETQLDNMQGAGSQLIKKTEQASQLYQEILVEKCTDKFIKAINSAMTYFENEEEYEKCAFLKKFLDFCNSPS